MNARRYQPYPAYKDSSVEWLGAVPAHWGTSRMWQLSTTISGGTPSKDEPNYWDGDIPWVSPKDMKRRFIASSEDTISERALHESGIRLIPPPAVLIVVRGMILAHSFPVAITTVPVTINQDMKALRLASGMDPEYVAWMLDGIGRQLLASIVDEAAHGTKAIRMEQLRSVTVAVPPFGEQRAITSYLDREADRIDALVARKERLIALLNEQRTAVISTAVTKGLDRTVSIKDANDEWLGAIPEHWEMRPVKSVAKFATGWTPPTGREDYYGGEHLWANISDLGTRVLMTTEKTITAEAVRHARLRIAPKGSLLFSFKLSVGTVSIAGTDMYTNEAIATFEPSPLIDTQYLSWAAPVLVPRNAQDNIYGAPLLSRDRIANARIPVPPVAEQREIAHYLDHETARIDALIAKVCGAIDRLKELRAALISAAVTGKIDVRDEVG